MPSMIINSPSPWQRLLVLKCKHYKSEGIMGKGKDKGTKSNREAKKPKGPKKEKKPKV